MCASSFRAGSLVEVLATLSFSLSKKSYSKSVHVCMYVVAGKRQVV